MFIGCTGAFWSLVLCIVGILALPLAATALQSGDFTYTTIMNTVTITGYTGAGRAITIPAIIDGMPVASIGADAFASCTFTNVTISNCVTSIGGYAFSDCAELTSITIPMSVTNIGYDAFYNCVSLTAINVDAANTYYCSVEGVLFNKSRTTLIQCSGGKIGSCTIPSIVTNIEDKAFLDCFSLTAINVDAANAYYSSMDGVLFNKSGTALIQCPGGKVGSFTIPSSVTNIRDDAFCHCMSLTSITIPLSVTNIGGSGFYNCVSLTNVTIPGSVTRIGYYAFLGCCRLTSITIPPSVKNIEIEAFSDCASMTAINVDAENAYYSSVDGVLFNKSRTALIQCPGGKVGSYTLPNGVTNIGYDALLRCTSLTSITVPISVTSIGDFAFYGCISLTGVCFQGNAPSVGQAILDSDNTTVYYLPGTTGWGSTFAGRSTVLWTPPSIIIQPSSQTVLIGTNVTFRVAAASSVPLTYQWNRNGNAISGATNSSYTISNVQLADAGQYTVTVFDSFTNTASYLFNSSNSSTATLVVSVPQSFQYPVAAFNGLFYPAQGIAISNSGLFTLAMTAKGKFTARALFPNSQISLSGGLTNGQTVVPVKLAGKKIPSYYIALQFGNEQGNDYMVGTLTDGASNYVSALHLYKAGKGPLTPARGSTLFTLAMPPGANASSMPGGWSTFTAILNNGGTITLAGTLGDGTKITQSLVASTDGDFPLFSSLYGNKGMLLGWLSFTNNTPGGDDVAWIKPANLKDKYYPKGFLVQTSIIGSSYLKPLDRAGALLLTNGFITMQDGNLAQPIVKCLVLINNKAVITTVNDNSLTLTANPNTGIWTGTFVATGSKKATPIKGVVLQQQKIAVGAFLGTNQSGSVELGESF